MSLLIERIRARLDALGLKPATAARAAGLHPDYLRNILEGKSLSPRADKLAQLARALQCDLPYLLGQDPAPHYAAVGSIPRPLREEPEPFGHAPMPGASDEEMPVYASREAAPGGFIVDWQPVEYVRRPAPLIRVRDAFGLYMIGTAMSPRYEPGDLLLIHPARPPATRDHVLALSGTGPGPAAAIVGRYLGRDEAGRIELDHYEPGHPPSRLQPEWHARVIVGAYEGRR